MATTSTGLINKPLSQAEAAKVFGTEFTEQPTQVIMVPQTEMVAVSQTVTFTQYQTLTRTVPIMAPLPTFRSVILPAASQNLNSPMDAGPISEPQAALQTAAACEDAACTECAYSSSYTSDVQRQQQWY